MFLRSLVCVPESVCGDAEQGRIRPGRMLVVFLGWDGQLWFWVAVEGE